MIKRLLSGLTGSLLLSACASSGAVSGPQPQVQPRVPVRAPIKAPPPRPRVLAAPGLEGVIGATPDDLVRQFGPSRLDVWEGDARKLQFSGTACVLDIYLYPEAAGRTPEATYVEARRASDGQEVDRAACIAALRGR
ncbi:MAG: hypothetical protein J0L64_19475 [Acidobacteria bacterium]|nr:hypothetical protein [Acidobacteriota bacterium]